MGGAKLLSRNEIPTVPVEVAYPLNEAPDSRWFDPLSKHFVVPPDVKPLPFSVVGFYIRLLCRKQSDGRVWGPEFGPRIYLRPAKQLLDEHGLELTVRAIVHAINVARYPPSFKFIGECIEQVQDVTD